MNIWTPPRRLRGAAIAALIRLTPDIDRHRLVDEMAEALRGYPHPIAPTTCACGQAMRSTPETDDDGDEVHTEPMSYQLDYSVGWQQAAHSRAYGTQGDDESQGYVWSVDTDHNDQHAIAAMCAGCQRLYTIPDTEEIVYG